ncbi:MAG: MinD/ParA family protein [Myxococcales bacterium]|nr:MinD/ParA family protein [Myxococcales bacterium]
MTNGDQAATLRRMSGSVLEMDKPRTRVVSITGGKGGVGKSTVSVNLAVAWARRGARTLALDCDMGMADLNLLLGVAPGRSLVDVLHGLPIEEALVEAHGIHLLPALNGSYMLANLDEASRHVLFRKIATLAQRFDTFIFDIPAGIGENAIAMAGAAAEVVIVATPEPLSLADAYACLKVMVLRQQLTRAYILPNNCKSPAEADDVFARLRALTDRFLGIELTQLPSVPYDSMVPVAAAAGMPLVIHSPDSPASRAFKQVARRLDQLAEDERPSSGFRSLLFLDPEAK